MALPTKRMVTVYAPDGKSYLVSNLNGNDMVRNLGYTYHPGKKFHPTDNAPMPKVTPKGDPAQAVLNSAGALKEARMGAEPEVDEPEVEEEEVEDTAPEAVVEPAEIEVFDPEELDADIEVIPAAAEAPKRRGRGK